MEFLLDTADLNKIDYYTDHLAISGVTTNPTILKKANVHDVFKRLRDIRSIIGKNKSLHAQAVGSTAEEIVKDAHRFIDEVDDQIYVKIPTNAEGLKAMKLLKSEGIHVTATAIYTEFQMYQAVLVGADYIAPYYNRMLNQNIDAFKSIRNIAKAIRENNCHTKILAASFHNVQQVTEALAAGSHAVTVGTDVLDTAFDNASVNAAIEQFAKDWNEYHPGQAVHDL